MKKIEGVTCIKFEDKSDNCHQELVFIVHELYFRVIVNNLLSIFLSYYQKPRIRIISNLLVEVIVIHKRDGIVVLMISFLLHIAPRNIHLSTRFILLMKIPISD